MSQDLQERPETEQEPQGPRLPPVAYPLLALVFGAILVWSFSRILLSLSPHAAVVVATLAALNILIGAALVAYGGRVRGRPAALPILVAAGIAVVAAGVVTAVAVGERAPSERAEGGGPGGPNGAQVALTAKSLKFEETKLTFPPNSRVSLHFVNDDQGVPHNFVLFDGKDESGPKIFRGPVVTGPGSTNYSFTAPGPGEYFFHCEIHPTTMKGTATVGRPGGGPPAPGGGGGPGAATASITAKNIAFSTKQLTVPGGGEVSITFTNSDNGIPHDLSVYEDKSATKVLYKGEAFPGPATKTLTFKAPPPGSYFFRCDIHPTQMFGTFVVR